MPRDLPVVLICFGVLLIVTAGVQCLLTTAMGQRTSKNVRFMGLRRAAEWWTPSRAERFSKIGALVFLILGGALLLAGIGLGWLAGESA